MGGTFVIEEIYKSSIKEHGYIVVQSSVAATAKRHGQRVGISALRVQRSFFTRPEDILAA
jgi:hypothetical protein